MLKNNLEALPPGSAHDSQPSYPNSPTKCPKVVARDRWTQALIPTKSCSKPKSCWSSPKPERVRHSDRPGPDRVKVCLAFIQENLITQFMPPCGAAAAEVPRHLLRVWPPSTPETCLILENCTPSNQVKPQLPSAGTEPKLSNRIRKVTLYKLYQYLTSLAHIHESPPASSY